MQDIRSSRILLVDDNGQLREMVTEILHREGFAAVDTAACVGETKAYLRAEQPDLVILDVNLPDGDGFSLMQDIRTFSQVPILFLSARDEDSDRLLGLGLGADDYMVKPFLPRELTLRISAILRRTYFSTGRGEPKEEILQLGRCRVDLGRATARWEAAEKGKAGKEEKAETVDKVEKEISLTAKELAILRKLKENRGNIVTFDQLCQTVWEDHYYGYENTIMVHIRRLREKIEENPSRPEYLVTVRGLGYRLK